MQLTVSISESIQESLDNVVINLLFNKSRILFLLCFIDLYDFYFLGARYLILVDLGEEPRRQKGNDSDEAISKRMDVEKQRTGPAVVPLGFDLQPLGVVVRQPKCDTYGMLHSRSGAGAIKSAKRNAPASV